MFAIEVSAHRARGPESGGFHIFCQIGREAKLSCEEQKPFRSLDLEISVSISTDGPQEFAGHKRELEKILKNGRGLYPLHCAEYHRLAQTLGRES